MKEWEEVQREGKQWGCPVRPSTVPGTYSSPFFSEQESTDFCLLPSSRCVAFRRPETEWALIFVVPRLPLALPFIEDLRLFHFQPNMKDSFRLHEVFPRDLLLFISLINQSKVPKFLVYNGSKCDWQANGHSSAPPPPQKYSNSITLKGSTTQYYGSKEFWCVSQQQGVLGDGCFLCGLSSVCSLSFPKELLILGLERWPHDEPMLKLLQRTQSQYPAPTYMTITVFNLSPCASDDLSDLTGTRKPKSCIYSCGQKVSDR